MEPLAETASLRAQVATLQAELDSLRARYDTLLEARNRAAERYKADYKKWRDFKRWLFHDAETGDRVFERDGWNPCKKASALGKRKQSEDYEPSLDTSRSDHGVEGLKQEYIPADIHSPPKAVASGHQHRKSYHGESSNMALSPASPGRNKDPFVVPPQPTNAPLVPNHKSEAPCEEEPSRQMPSTEPRKGRGRYADVPPGLGTINARFSIRKDKNSGVDFQYDAVVRNRQERRHMLGSDCECCREYYEAIGPLPASRQPHWRTPTKRKSLPNYHALDDDKENTDEVEEHKQRISRHRHHWHRPKTPPGYWDIGFPDTQEVLDINRRAAEMHKRKLIQVEFEARDDNSRYMERAPRTP